MAINGIGSGFNPYTNGVGQTRDVGGTTAANTAQRPATQVNTTAQGNTGASAPKSIAEAIKSDASARAAQVNSPDAPDGVDQELWSVLTKEERSFFVKAGAMGPLTYGRAAQSQAPVTAPIMRGGRLDIRA